jgi:hypothetical protein
LLPIILVFFLGPLSVSDMEILIWQNIKLKSTRSILAIFSDNKNTPTLKFVLY